ncbi:response regulator [Geovibrio thiophilus]|uniref:Response regulator n=1 Tax=Geovibrio thiophilus TaxID=139438 RepID=A0A3R5UW17_9BACT|nr:response regulator [Geovibrio thiophilus]QAR31914.1 response regulator [Geovibrio thiophilus]
MKKVLLIDDSVTIHRVIDICLDKDRFITEKTFSADDAVMKLKNSPADIVLLDNKLEGILLGDFIAKIRSLAPVSWIILLTGAFDQFDDSDLARSGADDYLFKPFDSQAIDLKINYGLNTAHRPAAAPAMPEQIISEEQTEILPAEEESPAEEAAFIDLRQEEPPAEEAVPSFEEESAEPETAEEEIPSAEDIFSEDEPETEEAAGKYGEEDSEDSFPFDDTEPSAAVSEEEKAELGNLFGDIEGLADIADIAEPETAEPLEEREEESSKAEEPEEDLDSFLKDLDTAEAPELEIIEEEETVPEPAAEDFSGLLEELGETEEPAPEDIPEYIIEEEEASDPFSGLTLTDEEDMFASPEPEAEPAAEYVIEEEKSDDGDIFANLMQISVEDVIDDKPALTEEEIRQEAAEPAETDETDETDETALDIITEGFPETGIPVDGEIVDEQQEADLSADAIESMPIETDFSELTPADESTFEETSEETVEEPVIIRDEETANVIEEEVTFTEETLPEPETAPSPDADAPEEITPEKEELPEAETEPAEPEFITVEEPEAEPAAFEEFPAEQFAPLKEMEEDHEPVKAPAVGLAQDEIKEIVYRSFDSGMFKSAIQEVLAEKMEEVLREVLPEIAEMVIREEIERLKRGE